MDPSLPPASVPDDLLDRYLAGEASLEERTAIRIVTDRDPEVAPAMKSLLALHLERSGATFNQRASWDALRTRIGDTTHTVPAHSKVAKSAILISRSWALAAAAALMVIAGSLGVYLSPPASPTNVTVRYATRAEERTTLTLPDGTRVTLAPQTPLEIGHQFGAANRTVTLIGTAYFDVTASASHPFVVRTGSVTTRVLGTAFTVRRYSQETTTQVAVASGRVAVGVNRFITLQRGDIAHVTDSTSTVMYGATLSDYTAWTTGKVSFTRARVTDVLTTIGQWYGVTFRLADSTLGNRHLTVVFNNSTRAQVLTTLKELLDVQMDTQGHVITIAPRSALRAPLHKPAPARHQQLDSMFPRQQGVGK